MARRDDREYREYLSEEQHSQRGCIAPSNAARLSPRAARLGAAGASAFYVNFPGDNVPIFDRSQIAEKYVAFIDILGFGGRVLDNFAESVDNFEQFLRMADLAEHLRPEVQVTVYSDSYLFVSSELGSLVAVIQGLHVQSLFCDYLIRGGIAYGRHVEAARSRNLYVVSEALVKAAAIEKTIRFPCVALHPDITLSDRWWTGFDRNLERAVLYFGAQIIVNPCNITWGTSAAMRVSQMLSTSPQY